MQIEMQESARSPFLIERISYALGVSPSEIRSSSKDREHARRRTAIAVALRAKTSMSFPAIGKLLGGFSHSTLIKNIQNHGSTDCPVFCETVSRVEAVI